MPKDVVIDSALAADSCTGCRNFTIAHEAAHHILADQFPNDYGKAVKCRGHIAYRERNGQPSWEEWQANTLAAELLMPTFLVNAEIKRAALCLSLIHISISSTESDIIHKEVFSIDHSFRNETGSIDSECIKCICDFIFEIVMKHIPFDGGRA